MTQRRIYQEDYPYFVTFRTRDGLTLFEDVEYAEVLAKVIFNAGRLKRFDILAYQIMPDHVHVLVRTNDSIAAAESRARKGNKPSPERDSVPAMGKGGYNISQFMYTAKSYFAAAIRTKYGINYSVLQPRFYARIVYSYQYLHAVIEYIKRNPVKDGLPEKYQRMPYQFVKHERG